MPDEITAATNNSVCSINYTMEAITMLQNAIKKAYATIDNRDKMRGYKRKLIGAVKASEVAFELIATKTLMHESLELEHTYY